MSFTGFVARAIKFGSRILSWFTAGRVLALGYVAVVSVASFLVPKSDSGIHFEAPRFLGKNTRIGSSLLMPPRNSSLEERFWLARERSKLEGKYLAEAITEKSTIAAANVRSWPDLSLDEAVPFELNAEPDWMFLNQGTTVNIRLDDPAQTQHAEVLAIVPSGNKWVALLRRADLKMQNGGLPTLRGVLNLERLPGKVAPAEQIKSPEIPSPAKK